ncbi:siroheme synthase CysG [Amphiplicatus metriothermophilus]|uniref:Uroporphyrin-III C-methyltransferase / precorrin-2 dehydrogenase / sirohydrochlorin ferrochelatase n=1 Tax=Amphiplicatus metriothermophilus TaxID=1519374 RepID=A0A239PM24_9PROT|nr:siroheme synthase CysG [Amphiplicatus metriothermophilus]MBB5517251.1 uroporphyrin-III C-methyltransferase/precorrin-2 dehydrogenase/sirohydrochlorin ferrochelatase [Amphiplicatus metriothermophilus]SNT68413.1 uroporphyrin-III C-methyltransferase / precorrin-2 dehydrogenase / sirohydrochlorin ferrochelatase [Amphiplicatus metriothermophilus]
MKQFPAFLDLSGRRIVIAGGGAAALQKARLFAAAGAELFVVGRPLVPALAEELADRAVLIERTAVANDFAAATLAVVAEDDEARAEALAAAAREQGALVNVVDRPELCDFLTPSIIDRGEVVVAVSTGGAAPVLGRRLRAQIETLLPARLGELAAFARSFRRAVAGKVPPPLRRRFWERFFDGPLAAQVLAGDARGAREAMLAEINRADAEAAGEGVVHIVGAGPGDPELLTLRALRLLQEADVILYDRLVGEEILALARRDAARVYVGKAKSNHALPQEEIEALLVRYAREGKRVVRLKGGDPFVFGRGGEELDALRAAGVRAFVTPGITAATGCAAAVGMPLTHRDHAQAVTFVTGHAKGEGDPDLDWSALARLGHTLVVYMGVGKARRIAENLIGAGRAPATPVAVVENGARPDQRALKGTLAELGALIEEGGVKGPAILVVGEVAALAEACTLDALARELAERAAA